MVSCAMVALAREGLILHYRHTQALVQAPSRISNERGSADVYQALSVLLRVGGVIRTLGTRNHSREPSIPQGSLQGRPVGIVRPSRINRAIAVPIAAPYPAPRARAIEPVDDRAQMPAIDVLPGVG